MNTTPETRTITFDPVPHTYTDETGKRYTSATTLIGKVEPVFDAEFWAMYRAIDKADRYKPRPFLEKRMIEITYYGKRRKFPISALYEGAVPLLKDPAVIRAEWKVMADDACDWGNKKHDYLESCVNKFADTKSLAIHHIPEYGGGKDYNFKVTNLAELENSPLRFTYPTIYERIAQYVRAGWVVYAEKRIYVAEFGIAGTIDLLLVKGKKFMIIDWKTNKKPLIFTSGYYKKEWNADRTKKIETKQWVPRNETFKYPLTRVPHCKGETYTLQISLYAYMCELWGLEYHGNILCHIRPHLDANGEPLLDAKGDRIEHEPEFHFLKYRKGEIRRLFDWHIGVLKAPKPVRASI